jgi:modulator of FtsH protease
MQPELQPVRSNESTYGTRGAAVSAESQRVLRNTYLLLALTMVPTIVGAFIGIATAPTTPGSLVISSLVVFAAVIGLQFAIIANRNSVLGIAFLLLMTGMLGWWLGPLLNYALATKGGMQLVGYSAAGTGVIFLAMGAIATTTKRDFSFMGKFLFVGMWSLVIAMFANMFLQIPALALTICTLVIVVFSLFLLFDLSRIVKGGETNYIVATTGVYLSLYNIFASLLQILLALAGGQRN